SPLRRRPLATAHATLALAPPSPPTSAFFFFFFNDTAPTEIYTLSLHDALPISRGGGTPPSPRPGRENAGPAPRPAGSSPDRCRRSEETRLNSSHVKISYAVFCLKKKKKENKRHKRDTTNQRRALPACSRDTRAT